MTFDSVNRQLKAHLPLFMRFKEALKQVFLMDMKESYNRRPSLGLRLTRDNKRLVVRPQYITTTKAGIRTGTINPDHLHIELIDAENTTLAKYRLAHTHTIAATMLWINDDINTENVNYMIESIEGFLADPQGWLAANSAGRCCFCHKQLTDAISVTRGIGPECIQRFSGLSWFAARNGSTYFAPLLLNPFSVDLGVQV